MKRNKELIYNSNNRKNIGFGRNGIFSLKEFFQFATLAYNQFIKSAYHDYSFNKVSNKMIINSLFI